MAPEKNYKQQKLKRSRLIVKKARELARKSGLEITEIKWDNRSLNVSREDFHTLTIIASDRSVKETFYEENVADFPYDDGVTIDKILHMINVLKG